MTDNKFDYRARIFDCAEPCDLSDDFTLPDYMPAVGRVLSCTASAAPPSLYVAGGSAEFAGGVRYRLLYESADDSSLWCAELPAEYDIFIDPERGASLPSDAEDLCGMVEAKTENTTARVTAPRRLSIRSRIRLSGAMSSPCRFETALRGDLSAMSSSKSLRTDAKCGTYSTAVSSPISCRDTISFAEAGLTQADELRIISARGDAALKSAEMSGNTAECRGELCVTLLFVREGDGERPRRLTRKIPFSAAVETDLPSGSFVGLRAYAACPSVTASADENGILIESDAIVCTETAAQDTITYLKDIYSTRADCELAKSNLHFPLPVACFNGNATVGASASLSDLGFDSGMKLCDFNARITETSSNILADGKLTLNGKMKVSAIADNGGELITAEFDSDIKYSADIPEAVSLSAPRIEAIPTLHDLKCRIDGDRLHADCELFLALKIEDDSRAEVVSEVNFMPAAPSVHSASEILICYPSHEETLWDVAKRYRADAEKLAEKNSLSAASPDAPDSLADTKYLII